MKLRHKKLHIRYGNKGQKLQKRLYNKNSAIEALTLFSSKKRQKMIDGYHIIHEQPSSSSANMNQKNIINGRRIFPNVMNNKNNHQSFSFSFGQKPKQQQKQFAQLRKKLQIKPQSNPIKRLKINKKPNQKKKKNRKRNKKVIKEMVNSITTEDTEDNIDSEDQVCNEFELDENQMSNGFTEHSSSSIISSESTLSSSSKTCASGRLSDNEYEMDYEIMSNIMYNSLNVNYTSIKQQLKWHPLKLWIKYNEVVDNNAEYAFAPMIKRIAGSCHELFVIYIKSGIVSDDDNSSPKIYQRLLKLARDPEEDNEHHFKTERHVSQYLTKMAICINRMFDTRTNVCVWPVETVLFEYDPILFNEHRSNDSNDGNKEKTLKWATVQAPFLPHPSTNNIFVKIEPNSGKACVNDPCVNRYQHMFCAITKGLNIVRDWQGYGINQQIFLNVCKKFNVEEAIFQIPSVSYGMSYEQRCSKNVLIIIDPVLTTYSAHFETNNATDFGLRAMNEWKMQHNCCDCRCSYFYLKDINECQFGFGDPLQVFLSENAPNYVRKFVDKCRQELNIYGYSVNEKVWNPPTNEEIENMDYSLMYESARENSCFIELMKNSNVKGGIDLDGVCDSKDEEKNGDNGKSDENDDTGICQQSAEV